MTTNICVYCYENNIKYSCCKCSCKFCEKCCIEFILYNYNKCIICKYEKDGWIKTLNNIKIKNSIINLIPNHKKKEYIRELIIPSLYDKKLRKNIRKIIKNNIKKEIKTDYYNLFLYFFVGIAVVIYNKILKYIFLNFVFKKYIK